MSKGVPGQILHVDDERSVRDSMSLLLQLEGYEIRSASSGACALQLVNEGFRPDVLITDFNLDPQMNGAEVAERIGGVMGYRPAVIMLTANVSAAKFPRNIEVVVWMASKPLNPQLLLEALPELIQISRATRS